MAVHSVFKDRPGGGVVYNLLGDRTRHTSTRIVLPSRKCPSRSQSSCSSVFFNANAMPVMVDNIDQDIFEEYEMYVRSGFTNVTPAHVLKDVDNCIREWKRLTQGYILATRLQNARYANLMVDRLIESTTHASLRNNATLLHLVRNVYDATHKHDPIQQLLVNIAVWRTESKAWQEVAEEVYKDCALALPISYMCRVLKNMKRGGGTSPFRDAIPRNYHASFDHRNTRSCMAPFTVAAGGEFEYVFVDPRNLPTVCNIRPLGMSNIDIPNLHAAPTRVIYESRVLQYPSIGQNLLKLNISKRSTITAIDEASASGPPTAVRKVPFRRGMVKEHAPFNYKDMKNMALALCKTTRPTVQGTCESMQDYCGYLKDSVQLACAKVKVCARNAHETWNPVVESKFEATNTFAHHKCETAKTFVEDFCEATHTKMISSLENWGPPVQKCFWETKDWCQVKAKALCERAIPLGKKVMRIGIALTTMAVTKAANVTCAGTKILAKVCGWCLGQCVLKTCNFMAPLARNMIERCRQW